jgi:hypothetical protein
MEIAVLIALALLIVLLVGISIGTRAPGETRRHKSRSSQPAESDDNRRSCPLCGSKLERGERVRSVFYPSPGDTLAEIHGCRYCDGPGATRPRRCPVCREIVPKTGYVIARVFKRPGKTHVHVLGCTGCRNAGRK